MLHIELGIIETVTAQTIRTLEYCCSLEERQPLEDKQGECYKFV